TVPNGDFGADPIGSHSVTDWNLSGAANSQFTVSADQQYLDSPQVLNWTVPKGTTPQVIRTASTIPIPVANRTYTASVAESGLGSIGDCSLQVQVIDSVTGQPVANWRQIAASSTAQADCPSVSFVPANTDPVYIQITMTPSQATGASVTIDRVVLNQSMDYGILATITPPGTGWAPSAWGGNGQANGIENLPPSIQGVYQNVYSPTINGPGSVVQGQAAGAYCTNIDVAGTRGPVVIDGVTTYTSGDDTVAIDASNTDSSLTDPTNSRTIENCTVNYATTVINTIRAAALASIDISGYSSALVKGCTITNNPQTGIRAAAAGPGIYQTIENNTLTPNVHITNGYALSLGGSDINCLNNTVNTGTTGSSRGIGIGDGSISNLNIGGNTIIVREAPNREYGNSGTTARALEIRCYAPNTLTNINVHNNTLEAITGAGLMEGAIGTRIVRLPSGSSGITFTNNTFKAICVGPTNPGYGLMTGYFANALEIDDSEVSSQNAVLFQGNTFDSNGAGITLGGQAGGADYPVNNLLLVNNTFKATADPTALAEPFYSYDFGEQGQSLSGIQIYGSTYQNGAPSVIRFVGNGQKSVTMGWVLTIQVETAQGTPLSGATVNLLAADGTVLQSGTTNAQGSLAIDVGSVRYSGTTSPTSTTISPSALSVSLAGYTPVTQSLSMNGNKSVTVGLTPGG
ncbi:MAG: hypothetical protein ACYCS7_16875, partial [Acidimicrobiales bacterium]